MELAQDMLMARFSISTVGPSSFFHKRIIKALSYVVLAKYTVEILIKMTSVM